MPVAVSPPTLDIPCIDYASGASDEELAATLLKALATVGFLYVKSPGPGLARTDVRKVFQTSKELFDLPLPEKEAVSFDVGVGSGYTAVMGQFLGRNAERTRGDLKESFSIGPDSAVSIPTSAASAIPTLEAFRAACFAAGQRLLDLFTVALEIKDDRAYFRSRHTYGHNESLRLLHYPSFPKGAANDDAGQDGKTQWASLKVGSKDIRAGQHQDFGSNTLLFQSPPADDGSPTAVEGLELFVRRDDGPDVSPDGSGGKGWWIAAPKPEGVDEGGSMLVNVGVSMEAWSGGQFKATYHRVTFPTPPDLAPGIILPGRQSVVFFMIPDNDVLLTPVRPGGVISSGDGCETVGALFKKRMARAYAATLDAQKSTAAAAAAAA